MPSATTVDDEQPPIVLTRTVIVMPKFTGE
jgi:hypothetical protein